MVLLIVDVGLSLRGGGVSIELMTEVVGLMRVAGKAVRAPAHAGVWSWCCGEMRPWCCLVLYMRG